MLSCVCVLLLYSFSFHFMADIWWIWLRIVMLFVHSHLFYSVLSCKFQFGGLNSSCVFTHIRAFKPNLNVYVYESFFLKTWTPALTPHTLQVLILVEWPSHERCAVVKYFIINLNRSGEVLISSNLVDVVALL